MASIDDIKRLLNESWSSIPSASRPVEDERRHDDQLSSLAANLSAQMEYNNSLLLHIETLEDKLVSSERDFRSTKSELNQLQGIFQELVNQNTDLQRKFHSSAESTHSLTSECHDLKDELSHYTTKFQETNLELDRQKLRNKVMDDERSALQNKIRELESNLQWMHATSVEQSKEGSSMTARLRNALETSQSDVDELKRSMAGIEHELQVGKEENIKLHRATERLLRQVQDESFAKEEINSRNKDLMAENNALNQRYACDITNLAAASTLNSILRKLNPYILDTLI